MAESLLLICKKKKKKKKKEREEEGEREKEMSFANHHLLDDYPVFKPDLENYNHVDCKYSDISVFSNYKCNTFLDILMLKIRSIRKNIN